MSRLEVAAQIAAVPRWQVIYVMDDCVPEVSWHSDHDAMAKVLRTILPENRHRVWVVDLQGLQRTSLVEWLEGNPPRHPAGEVVG